jgi:hypothetical protein
MKTFFIIFISVVFTSLEEKKRNSIADNFFIENQNMPSLTKIEIASHGLQVAITLTIIVYAIVAGYVPYKHVEAHMRLDTFTRPDLYKTDRDEFSTFATVIFWIGIAMLLVIEIARVYFREIISSTFVRRALSSLIRVIYSGK